MNERRTDRRAWSAVADLETGLRLIQEALDELNPAYSDHAMKEWNDLRMEAHMICQMYVDRGVCKDALDSSTIAGYSYLLDEDVT